MNNFYITIPSNVLRPDQVENKTSNYTSYLPQGIELSGKWVVGLTEIIYPNSWYSLDDEECKLKYIDDNGKEFFFNIQNELVLNIRIFCNHLNSIFNDIHMKPRFLYNSTMNKINITIPHKTSLILNLNLAKKLGFNKNNFSNIISTTKKPLTFMSENMIDLNADKHFIYIYCNIIKSSIVGNNYSQILRVINTDISIKNTYAHTTFTNPIYIPVILKRLTSINIQLFNDQAKPMQFRSGKSLVVLHFKQLAI